MIIDESIEWRKRAFERDLKNTYYIKRPNGMDFIYENQLNKISE